MHSSTLPTSLPRRRYLALALIVLALCSPPVAAASLQELINRAHQHASARRFDAAEVAARQAVREHPGSREARLTLANILLWQEKYRQAAAGYRELLDTSPGHREARLGLANALYWSGDYRAARREYLMIADHPDAARSLGELDAASAPGARADAFYRSDSQPFRTGLAEAGGYMFTDPLTRWNASIGTYTFAEGSVDADAPFATAGVEYGIPAIQSTVRAGAKVMRFPDGETLLLPTAAIARSLGDATLSLTAARRELFGAERSLLTHAYADSLELRWHRSNASVRAEALRYFDDNSGVAADGWFLLPLGPASVGASAAWRDTSESRFITTGVYDPYWTPIDLVEGRLIVAFEKELGTIGARLHLDGGFAREAQNGSYNPWRAGVSLTVPVRRMTIAIDAERASTVFYTANEIRASLAARF